MYKAVENMKKNIHFFHHFQPVSELSHFVKKTYFVGVNNNVYSHSLFNLFKESNIFKFNQR